MFYLVPIGLVLLVFLGLSIRVVQQWQRGVVFFLGRYKRELKPGFNLIIPIFEYARYVDVRTRTMDVIPQEVMTKDSVPVKIDAVVYYRVFDAMKSIVQVENFMSASTLLAQSKLRDVVGKYDLDTLLASKDKIGKEILETLQGPTDDWGITIVSVEIKNIELPDNMKRAMAKEAEAIREKRARQIKASAEEDASASFLAAAKTMEEAPEAMLLRQLQTWQEIGAEQNSLIILVPTEFAKLIGSTVPKKEKKE
jgi:regulator of protease activity HflC (stomatin/prohibitin superfamily)